MAESTPRIPDTGSLAVDTKRKRVGVVMGKTGPYVQLRPEGGGKEWDASPADLRPATAGEALSPRVRAANERSTGARL
ncbi:hypothetical protein [Streptomyces pacificus]|uniref:Uncharacterized protein n=1 Tax=Streptomyces pacificus TaxID=2705029 RepID=A0A6A0APU8_9ACTN|nr:hypothetical protein [Streptomyces pacificus]GFH35029.1 hypothetical protein SCWH03_12430 [Streptomyces pacificus]